MRDLDRAERVWLLFSGFTTGAVFMLFVTLGADALIEVIEGNFGVLQVASILLGIGFYLSLSLCASQVKRDDHDQK